MNMRNGECVGTQTSKISTRVTLLFIFYSVLLSYEIWGNITSGAIIIVFKNGTSLPDKCWPTQCVTDDTLISARFILLTTTRGCCHFLKVWITSWSTQVSHELNPHKLLIALILNPVKCILDWLTIFKAKLTHTSLSFYCFILVGATETRFLQRKIPIFNVSTWFSFQYNLLHK